MGDSLVTYLALALIANSSVTSCLRTRAEMFVTFKMLLLYTAQPSSSFSGIVLYKIAVSCKQDTNRSHNLAAFRMSSELFSVNAWWIYERRPFVLC
jgi:hypothetical protein